MNGGYFNIDREAENRINCYIAEAVYIYLCKHAVFMPKVYKINDQNEVQLSIGQYVTSAEKICDDLKKQKGLKESLSTIKRRIKMLQDLDLIEIKQVKQGRRIIANIFTVKAQFERSPALQPQGIEQIGERLNDDFERLNERLNERSPALQPQGIEQIGERSLERSLERSIIKKKELKEKGIKENNIKQAEAEGARDIPENNSIVNTFGIVFKEFEKLLEDKKIHEYQVQEIGEIYDSGMEVDLILELIKHSAINGERNRIRYFFNTCRDLLKENILTLDKWQQNAAKYKENRQRQYKQTGTEGNRQRQEAAVPDIDYDNMF